MRADRVIAVNSMIKASIVLADAARQIASNPMSSVAALNAAAALAQGAAALYAASKPVARRERAKVRR